MTDMNNLPEINDNFDTIKTMLNSIRAQGILNTSDVDKLLEGINSKLEKINTEEDINIIKNFLTNLKQNLDERHNTLISKFGAIESLFSNLLKNSSETLKSSELKELFDIVATNLSVFSREVVSQKETLTDITLRLDAMRSDDSRKNDIIKNISVLKSDIDKINNGFDSVVLSLNENFKTVLKTIAEVDQTEYISNFGQQIEDIVNSSNTILSAIQLLDKKNAQLDDSISNLVTKDELISTKNAISDLSAKSKELTDLVQVMTQKSYKIDNLADKIDASVNIIAGLKSALQEDENKTDQIIIDKLNDLETVVQTVSSASDFENFKLSLESFLKEISENSDRFLNELRLSSDSVKNLAADFRTLDLDFKYQTLISNMDKVREDIKEQIVEQTDKFSQLLDANISRTIDDVTENAQLLNSKLNDTQVTIADLCQKNFTDILEHISGLKSTVSQLDENNVAANNAIFSNVTDRLAMFESDLKTSLEKQENYTSQSSSNLIDQISSLKELTSNLDYKIDASIIELSNTRKESENVKSSIDRLLAQDFVSLLNDLRADLYASKNDLSKSIEEYNSDISEKLANDLFNKYELLISRLDNMSDEIKSTQAKSLNDLKPIFDNISASLLDILSYVSEQDKSNNQDLSDKLQEISVSLNGNNISYIENVRDIVDSVKSQIELSIKQINNDNINKINEIGDRLVSQNDSVKTDIKNTFNKLIEVENNFNKIKELIDVNSLTLTTNIQDAITTADGLKSDFEARLFDLKNSLLEKVSDYKKEFSCESADIISEFKFNSETLHTKAVQNASDLKNELKDEIENTIDTLKTEILELNNSIIKISDKVDSSKVGFTDCVKTISDKVDESKVDIADYVKTISDKVDASKVDFADCVKTISDKVDASKVDFVDYVKTDLKEDIGNTLSSIEQSNSQAVITLRNDVEEIKSNFANLDISVQNLAKENTAALTSTLAKILEHFVSLKTLISNYDEQSNTKMQQFIEFIREDFETIQNYFENIDKNIDEDLTRQLSIIERNFESLNTMISHVMAKGTDILVGRVNDELQNASETLGVSVGEKLEQFKSYIDNLFDNISSNSDKNVDFIKSKILELNTILEESIEKQTNNSVVYLNEISENLKTYMASNFEMTFKDYDVLKEKINLWIQDINNSNELLVSGIQSKIDDITNFVKSIIDIQSQDINSILDKVGSDIQNLNSQVVSSDENINSAINRVASDVQSLNAQVVSSDSNINSAINRVASDVQSLNAQVVSSDENINDTINTLSSKIQTLFENESINLLSELSNTSVNLSENINEKVSNLKSEIDEFKQLFNNVSGTNANSILNKLNTISADFNSLIEQTRAYQDEKAEALSNLIVNNYKDLSDTLETNVEVKGNSLLTAISENSLSQTQAFESLIDDVLNKVEAAKQNSTLCKDIITKLLKEQLDSIVNNIEKETDVITGDLLEQFAILKDTQKDELQMLGTNIEGVIEGYICDSVNDIKSYLDIKTDSSILNTKLDNLKTELENSSDSVLENINKLLEISVFSDAISDLKTTNQVLVTSMADDLNKKLTEFITENVSNNLEDKFNYFDKKFIDTIVDKYESIKLITTEYGKTFDKVELTIGQLLSAFNESRKDVDKNIEQAMGLINKSIENLSLGFSDLKAQILNKSFDKAFQASMNNQISGIESLIKEELGYLEDVSELCSNNLPELTEMNTIVKHSIQKGVNELISKVDDNSEAVENGIKTLKTDIITQFINIFNQISFVTEQEEIIDFIQEKHSELVTILSHIVTTVDDVTDVKDNLTVVDNKISDIKEDIDLINEKITSMMSADGNIDYVYSLQDLESDIANLRVVLNEMKADNKSKEFEELFSSTDKIYSLVETIRSELPRFEAEEFKKDFNNLADDIVSISTRTNKLILTSDESYKALQDNLQDFKLVINDLDERSRNFVQDAGIDKIDDKLAALNTQIQNGAKTNQVFNQVFEYLAEWVDKAGDQINAISDKVETLDDIGQIKVMLEDLKAEAEDSSESTELVNTLSNIFDKQAKRISSLEAKIDRMVVENTINNKNNKIDLTPMEDTLNRFLAAMDDKLASQQTKINSLEEKLAEMCQLVDNKDTAQLTKKVGGMDRQIAKLNKSIEKIASHVVEK